MNFTDEQLIKIAENTSYFDWDDIKPERAESKEAKEELKRIRARKYRQEESTIGLC